MKRKLTEPLKIYAIGQNYTANGFFQLDGRVRILKGSLMSPFSANSTRGKITEIRKRLLNTIVKNNYFTEEYVFENHSEAASVISGSMRSGNFLFRTIDGIPLNEFMEVPYNDFENHGISRDLIEEDDSNGILNSIDVVPNKIEQYEHTPKVLEDYLSNKTGNIYKRNQKANDVALSLANFKCEIDNNHNTFVTKNGAQYVEGHHLIPLNSQGDLTISLDVPANIVSLCPNCHRQLHYGSHIERILNFLFEKKRENLFKSGIKIDYKKLLEYYG